MSKAEKDRFDSHKRTLFGIGQIGRSKRSEDDTGLSNLALVSIQSDDDSQIILLLGFALFNPRAMVFIRCLLETAGAAAEGGLVTFSMGIENLWTHLSVAEWMFQRKGLQVKDLDYSWERLTALRIKSTEDITDRLRSGDADRDDELEMIKKLSRGNKRTEDSSAGRGRGRGGGLAAGRGRGRGPGRGARGRGRPAVTWLFSQTGGWGACLTANPPVDQWLING